MKILPRSIVFGFTCISVLVFDTYSKHLVGAYTGLTPRWIIDGFVSFDVVYNSGIAFGIEMPGLIFITPVLICILMTYFFFSEWEKNIRSLDIGYALIISGAIGNAWQRVFLGYVTDFLSFTGLFVCNIADIAITFGVILILYASIFYRKHIYSQTPKPDQLPSQ